MKMKAFGITIISLALTTAVIGNAYYQKKQFYPSVVYITKSNPSMAVSFPIKKKCKLNQIKCLLQITGNLYSSIYLGTINGKTNEKGVFWPITRC